MSVRPSVRMFVLFNKYPGAQSFVPVFEFLFFCLPSLLRARL